MKKGFTLIEAIITIAISIILISIVINSMSEAKIKKQMEGIADNIVVKLEEAKTNSSTGRGGDKYGVKFNSNSFINFVGDSFDPMDSGNQITEIDPKFEISNTLTTTDDVVVFDRLTGDANLNATVTVSQITDPTKKIDILIGSLGDISVIK